MIYGYVRVSTNDQSEERQLLSMRKFGISAENIFVDKQSGQNFERPAYKKLLERLKPADLVVIESLDRLGQKLFRDTGAMAHNNQRKTRKHRRLGHADIGHATQERFNRYIGSGYNLAGVVVCGANRTRVHDTATSGRNRGGKGSRNKMRASGQTKTAKLRRSFNALASRRNICAASRKNVKLGAEEILRGIRATLFSLCKK